LCNKARARIFENLHLFTFLRAHPAERFFAWDCAGCTQSRANPFGRLGAVGRDHFQPHNRQRFASRSFAKPHCLACRMGSRQSAGEFLNQLVPRKLRERRLLRHSDLYRGSNPSLSLRHAVWTAEKRGSIPLEIARNRRNLAYLAIKLDWRECTALLASQALRHFSLEGKLAVRFQTLREANATRSQTGDLAKAR
jgi:hypothetical protein